MYRESFPTHMWRRIKKRGRVLQSYILILVAELFLPCRIVIGFAAKRGRSVEWWPCRLR